MSSSYDLRRSMTATYDQEERRRPARRPPPGARRRGPVHHAFKEEVTERPAWFYPVLIGAAVVVASAIVLFMLIGPKDLMGNIPSGTGSAEPVDLVIGGVPMRVPENYTQFPRDRAGGTIQKISLYAALPKFTPYTENKQHLFFDNAANSPVVFFELRATPPPLSEAERKEAVYMQYVSEGGGGDGPGSLTRYEFKEESPFAGEDMFVGKDVNGEIAIIRCSRRSGMVPSPNCWRDTALPNGLALSYRFKRPYLQYWQGIDRGLRTLIERFRGGAAGRMPASAS